jgi:hypothetical protein
LYSAKIGKNGASTADVVGYGYLSDVSNITVPVNLISNIASGFQTFSIGDTVRVEIYAQKIGAGSNPTITQTIPLIQAVYNALSNQNVVLPPSGQIQPVSVTAGPQEVSPLNTYTFRNQTGGVADLFTYPTSTLVRTLNTTLITGETSSPITSINYYDVVVGTAPPPFPTSPITILTDTSETPIAIDPLITYTFINNSGGDLVLTAFTNGTPTSLANPFANNATVIAPSAGFTGYTATIASPPPPPPFPTSPITLTGVTGPTPIGLNPAIQYTFINQSGETLRVEGYVNGSLLQTLQIDDTQSDQFFDVGFTGYIALAPF